jgi:secondary thiamine-phosphate synthase enzyme
LLIHILYNACTRAISKPQICSEDDKPLNEFAGLRASNDIMAAKWAQKTIVLPPHKRGCHLVTSKILKEIESDLSGFKCGLAHFFLQHTSASLTVNENYDSDVQHDAETFLNRIVPEGRSAPWKHTMEAFPASICLLVFADSYQKQEDTLPKFTHTTHQKINL